MAFAALLAMLFQDDVQGQSNPPAVSAVTPPYIVQNPGAPDHFKRFDQVNIYVTFSRAVTVTGSPRIALDIGGVERYATYSTGVSNFLLFAYVVGPDDVDADGIDIVANSLELRGGSITGVGDGEAAVLDHPTQRATDTRRPVDGVAPVAILVGDSSGYEHPDNLVAVGIGFSEPVTGLTVDDFTVTNGVAVDLEEEPFGVPGTYYSFQITHGGEGAVTVTLSSSAVHDAAGNGNTASAVLRIIVADPTRVSISPISSNTVEGQPVSFSLTRSKDNGARTVVVEVSQAGDFLSGSTSFGATISTTPVEVSIDFLAGELTKTLSLDTEDDYHDDADGSVTLTVKPDPTEVGYVAGARGAATASVRDNDEAPSLYVHQTSSPVFVGVSSNETPEGAFVKFIFVRTHDAGEQILDAQITQQGDFLTSHRDGLTVPSDGLIQITFPAGILSTYILLKTNDDTVNEADGTVTITVLPRPSDSLYPIPVQGTRTMALLDNDGPPTVTITADAASVTEGSDATVTVSRTNAPGEHTRRTFVRLLITDPDGALAPGTNLSPFIAILDGQTEHTLALETVNDQVAEQDGNVTVRVLSITSVSAPYVVGTPDSATVEVADDEDPIVSVSADVSTLTEGTDAQFRFSRIGSTKSSLTVGVNIFGHHKIMSAATRLLGANVGPMPDTTVTFSPGMTEAILLLSTEADQVNEGDGELRVSIMGSPAYEKDGNGSAKVLVEDDDIPEVTLRWITPAMTLEDNVWVGTMLEGGAIDWTVDCSGNTLAPVAARSGRVPFKYQSDMNHPQAALRAYDFTFHARHPCAGDPNSDRYLSSYRPAGIYSRRFTGPDNGTITFDLLPQALEVPDGLVTRCFQDDLPGTPENLRFCPKFTLGDVTSARIFVRNRNPTITVEALDESVNEGDPARFKLTRIWAPDLLDPTDLLANLTTAFDFTTRGVGGYTTALPSGQREFAHAVTEMIVEIPTLDDDLPGADGSVTFELLPGSPETQLGNVGGSYEVYDFLEGITPAGKNSRVATVNILNEDVYPLLSITDATAEEGDPVEFVVTLSGAHNLEITVDWNTSDGTAELTHDYASTTSSGTITFAPGETEQTISVSTLEDIIPERDEAFTVTLSNPVQVTLPMPATATGTITNDDNLPVVTILAYETPILEGNNPKFMVTRQGLTDDRVDVQLSLTKDGAPLPDATVAIPVGQYSAIHTVDHARDEVAGQDHQYIATVLSDSSYSIGSPGSATVDLLDDDTRGALAIEVHPDSYTYADAGDVINFTYYVKNVGDVATGSPVRAHTNVSGSFVVTAHPIPANVFLPGNLEHTAEVTVAYTITAADVTTGYVLLSWYAEDGIYRSPQDDIMINVEGRVYRYSIVNPATTDPEADDEEEDLTLQIWRQDSVRDSHVVRVYTTDDTATQPDDYAAVDETLTFSFKQRHGVTLAFNDDVVDEPHESFNVFLVDAATGDTLYAYTRVGIDDNDDPVEIFVTTTHENATNEGWPARIGQPVVQVNLALPGLDEFELAADGSAHVVELSYETVDGTATAGEDYTHVSGLLRYEPGTNLQSFTVPILDDKVIEDSETLYIRFSDGQHVTIPSGQELFEMTIDDDDVRSTSVLLSMDPTEVAEDAGPTEITVTATLNSGVRPANSSESLVLWQVLAGTATLGTDYAAVPAVVMTIPPGQVSGSATFTFAPVNDGEAEGSFETVIVAGSSYDPSLAVIPLSGLTLQIRDDDALGVAISPTQIALDEGTSATYTVALTSQPTGTVSMFAGFPADASISQDLSTLTFNANNWATPQTVTVTATSDADAVDEQVTINYFILGADYGSVLAPPVDVSVTDDDTPSTSIVLVSSRPSLTEDGGDKTIRITAVYLNAAAKDDTTVQIQVSANTAFPGSDFVAVEPFDIVIPAGSTNGRQTFTLSPVNDDVDESAETISITGQVTVDGVPDDGALPVTTATVTINDDDSRGVVVTPTALTMEEDGEESYTIVLTSAPSETSHMAITVPANSDLRVSPTGIYFHSGNWNVAQTVRVTSLGDADVSDHTVILTHSFTDSDYQGITVDDVSVTITEHTSTAMSTEDVRGAEGSTSLDFVVTLDRAISTTATVQYRTVGMAGNNGVTATSGDDYTDASGTLTFAPGETRKTVPVSLMDDGLNEAEEYLEFVLERPTNAELPQPTTYTVHGIIEDDDPLPVVSVAGSTAGGWSYAVETAGPLAYTVGLSEPSARNVQVDYATVDRTPGARNTVLQTATASSDYVPQNGTLTFLPGETTKSLSVTLNDDQVSEGDEIFALDLSNPKNAVLSNQGWGVIRDEDVRGLVLTPPTLTLDEDTSSEYYVTLSSQPTATVTVSLTASNGVTLDVSSLSFSTTDWSTEQKVTVTAADDADAADGAATITHALAGGDYQGLSAVEMTVNIRDTDVRNVVISATSVLVPEGGSSSYTVVLTSQPTGSVTVTPSRTGSPDVTVSPSPLTFTTGNWSTEQTVTVSAVHDPDAANDAARVSHSVSGADYEDETAPDVSVTVSEDETASTMVVLSVDTETVTEDAGPSTVTVTATLNHAPRTVNTVVTVTVGDSNDAATEGTDYETIGSLSLYIVAGATSGTLSFTLTPSDDDRAEGDEELTVDGSVSGLSVTATTVTIADDDNARVTVSKTALTVVEEDSVGGSYTLVLDSQPSADVVVTVAGHAGSEVSPNPTTLTFTSTTWSTAQTVTVTAADDVDGSNDTVSLTHSATSADADYGAIAIAGVEVTVTDDETPSTEVILTVDPEWASEADALTSVRLTATLDEAPRSELTIVTVMVGASGDSAVEGTDYETIGELTLTIPEGQTSTYQTIQFQPINDGTGEGDESLSISGTTTVTSLTVTGTQLVLLDDERPRSLTLSAMPESVAEDGGPRTVVVRATSGTGPYLVETPVTVVVGASQDSAASGTDYTSVDEFTITVAAGATSATGEFQLTPTNDSFGEGDETISVSGRPTGPPAVVQGTEVTIVDDETPSTAISLSVSPNNLSEGASDTTLTVTGTLNNDARSSATNVTVMVGAASDTAVEGTDYGTVGSLTLTIGASQTTGTTAFQLNPTDDDLDEGGESLTVDGSVSGLSVTSTTVTIRDDDTAGVTVSPTTLTVAEGESESYTVVLTSKPSGTVTVTPSRTGSADVTFSPSPLTFTTNNWSTAQTVTVQAAQDADALNDTATLSHAVSGADYGTVTASSVAVTVSDDETVSTGVVLTVNPATLTEGGGAKVITITATLNQAPRAVATVLTLSVGAASDTALEGTDYGTVGSLTLTIGASQTTGTTAFQLNPTDDDLDEGGESLTVDGSVSGLSVTSTTVTIRDDDTAGVTVSPTTLTVAEGESESYTVVLTSQPSGTVTVTPSRTGSADVTFSPSPLTFTTNNWSTAQTVTVQTAQDTDALNDTATVSHAVSGADYGTVTASSVAVTVSDDETVSTGAVLSVNPATLTEGGGAKVITITATLNQAPRAVATVLTLSVGAASDTAVEGTDYGTVGSLTLTIGASQTTGTTAFQLNPTDDDLDEGGESLTVDGSVSGLSVTSTTVTIRDNDTAGVTVSPTTLTVAEGNNSSYTVVLTSQPSGNVTVTPSRTGSTDVTVSTSPLTFTSQNWSTAQTVTVQAAEDTDALNDTATVSHAVSGADYGTVTASSVAVTVSDDETVSTGVVLSVNPATLTEGGGAKVITITATLNQAPRAVATVLTLSVGAASDTAVEGTDYGTVGSQTLTISAGAISATKTFTLTPTADDRDEDDESLTIDGSVTGLSVTATMVTIEDDDTAGVTVSPATLTVAEGGSSSYTVVLTSKPSGTVTVTPSRTGSTDVTFSPSPLTFTPQNWSTAQTVTVQAAEDTDALNDTATLSHAVSGADYGTVTASSVAVTVTDDETVSTRVVLSVDPSTLSESAGPTTVRVTATLNQAPRNVGTVLSLSVGESGDTAVEGTDYGTVGSLTLTISAGAISATKTFTLTPTADDRDEDDESLTIDGSVTGLSVTATMVTIEDDDTAGVTVSPTTLTVAEGGSSSYTVVLTSKPSGTVTVTPSRTGSADVTFSPSPLTFTPQNWSTAQTVTVQAAEDTDALNDTATLSHAVSGADYGTVTASSVAVTVSDDETVSTGVVLSVNPSTLSEGAGATEITITATLNQAPRNVGTVLSLSVGESGDTALEGTDYGTVGSLTLTISAGAISATKTFTLTPTADDRDEDDESLTIDGSVSGLSVTATTVTIEDDDTAGVTVSPTTLTVAEGESESYTVVLTSQPSGAVTVTPSRTGSTDVTVSTSPLTFTPQNWSTAQTVTVQTAQDTDALNDTATVSHAVSGADYGTVTASSVAVTVSDDETVSTGVVLSVNPATLTEGGGAKVITITATLNQAPRAVATVLTLSVGAASDTAVEGTDYGTVGSQTLTISAGAISATKTFTLTPTADDRDEDDESLTIDGSVTGLSVTATTVTIEDDDTAGVTVSPTTLTVAEGGSSSYTVVLTSQPSGAVTVTPSRTGSTDVTVSTSPLTFTPQNWSTAQTVTVQTAQDTDALNDTATLSHAVSGADYGTVTASSVAVTVSDDETVSTGVVLSVNPATLTEGGGAKVITITATLNQAPRAVATVLTLSVGAASDTAVEGTDYGTVGSQTLTISAGAISATKTFTLNPTDDDLDEDDESLTIDGSVTGLSVTSATVTIEDDDTAGVTVSPATLTVAEGGSSSYTVVLTSKPSGTVTVTPSRTGSADVTFSPSPLTFTPQNWSTAQTVTVQAAEDTDALNDTATLSHAVSGADYGTVTASSVAVTVSDDETVSTGVVLSVNPATLTEGGGAKVITITATLNQAPRAVATVLTLSVGAASDTAVEGTDYGTVGSQTLTISAGAISATKTFTLNPTDDDLDEDDESLTIDGSVTGLSVTSATVTIEDDDTAGVTVSPATLTVAEGGSSSYTVVLTSKPSGTVTVTPSRTGSADVTFSPSPLTFTPQNWSTAQTVTVQAAEDTDALNDTATLSHAVSGADYGTVTASSVAVTVSDDETVSTGVVLSVNPSTLSEGAGATEITITATLNQAPRNVGTVLSLSVGESGDTALEGTDYGTVGSLTLTISAGAISATKTFTLTPTADDRDEDDESLTIDGSVTGLSVTATTVTIEDDDTAGVTVSPTTLTVAEGNNSSYTVVLTSQPSGNVTVTPSRTGSTDVTVSTSPLTFTPQNWSTAQTVTVQTAQDTDALNDTATVSHAVSGADYGTVTAASVAVTVSDDETVSTGVVLSVNPATLTEGGGAKVITITATLNQAPRAVATVLTLSVGAASDTAVEGTDYGTVGSQTLTISAGAISATKTFTLNPTDDDLDEDDESLTIDGSVTGLSVTATTVTIEDDDSAGVTVNPTTLAITEGDSETYTIKLQTQPTGTVTVGVNQPSNTDITANPATLTFTTTTWNTAQTITVAAAHDPDSLDEPTTSITHTVSGGGYGSVIADSVAVTVTDAGVPQVTVVYEQALYRVVEGDSITVMVRLSQDPERTVTIPITKDNQGTTRNRDYSGVPETLTINSGGTRQSFTFAATLDDREEGSQTVKLGFGPLPAGVSPGITDESTVLITDGSEGEESEDLTLTVRFKRETYAVTEGRSVTVKVKLSADPGRTVTIPILTAHQPGATAADYSGVPPNVTFNSGTTEATFSVSATADTVDEYFEVVRLSFGTLPDGVQEGDIDETNVRIRDTVRVTFLAGSYVASEGGSDAQVSVSLSDPAPSRISILLTALGGNGATAADWSGVPEELVFAKDDQHKTFAVTAIDDPQHDSNELVHLSFGTLPVSVAAGDLDTATVVLMSTEPPAPSEPIAQPLQNPGCNNQASKIIILDAIGVISVAGQSDFWRVELDPQRLYIIEVLGSESGFDVLDEDTYPGELTLHDADLVERWNADRTVRIGGYALSGHYNSIAVTRETEISGVMQFEVQSGDGGTGTYQIKVRVNNVCGTSPVTNQVIFPWGGGPDGYINDTRADTSTTRRLDAHSHTDLIAVSDFLGDNWDSAPDEDWHRMALLQDHTYTLEAWAPSDVPVQHRATQLTILGIRDSNGDLVPGTSSGTGNRVSVVFEPQAAGTYYLAVGSGAADRTGAYMLGVRTVANNPVNQGQSLRGPTPVTPTVKPPTAEPPPPDPPTAPQNLSASVNSDGSITLTWDTPADQSVTGYQILRRRAAMGERALLVYVQNTGTTATTFTDTDVIAGTRHNYRVKAINEAGLGKRSNVAKVVP